MPSLRVFWPRRICCSPLCLDTADGVALQDLQASAEARGTLTARQLHHWLPGGPGSKEAYLSKHRTPAVLLAKARAAAKQPCAMHDTAQEAVAKPAVRRSVLIAKLRRCPGFSSLQHSSTGLAWVLCRSVQPCLKNPEGYPNRK